MSNINNIKKLKKSSIDGFYDGLIINFDLYLNKLDEERLVFYNCTFKNNIFISNYNLDDTFKTKLEFSNCKFEKKIKCDNILFEEMFVIKGTEKESFVNLEFSNVEFDNTVIFKGLIINDFILNEVEFNEEAFFYNINFKNKLNFIDTYFYKSVYFDGSSITVDNRRSALIIKDSFEQQNNIIEANKFYALEMKEREKELEFKKEPFEWLVFKVHGLVSNHSQDWTLALFWIINLTFFYSFLKVNIDENLILSSSLKVIFSFIAILVIGCMTVKISETDEKRWLTTIPTTLVCYMFYGYLVENDWSLSEYSKNLNPFSIMRGDEPITFGTLIFKIIIAYLIYQLIISIRQNTRRK